jgi:hypothetical protein
VTWRLLAASTAGTSHLRRGIPCQDAHQVLSLANGGFVAAAADGAGSAKHSDRGSRIAVECAVAYLADAVGSASCLDEDSCRRLLQNALEKVRSDIAAACVSPLDSGEASRSSDFATTLLMCFAAGSTLAACQVGDGAIVELENGVVRALTLPVRGEYLNETTFVTSEDFMASASFAVKEVHDTQSLTIFTDGIQSLAMRLSDDAPFAPFFQNIHAYACSPKANSDALKAFLDSERVCERTDDDKTIVVAVRKTERGNAVE